ncbi:MAG: Hint domain-containing protein [Pseudomonadota bacterium]|nr:Hint domain-containing protein [Pseudomonadota bacterium]
MPATYTDQFWVLDPYSPPPAGTSLVVQNYDLVDQDDDGDIGRSGGDTINGVDVTRAYPGDTVTVTLDDGSSMTVTGTTFYLANGTQVFTPTDGSVLEDATFASSSFVTTTGVLDVGEDLGPPCLTSGTLVQTDHGLKAVEDLEAGAILFGPEGQRLTLRMVLKTSFCARELGENSKLLPVRIVAGALGNGLPKRDLLVSRQHRMLLNAPMVKRMFGHAEVLVPAIRLTDLPGIYVDHSVKSVTYYHLVFDQHEIIYAEGAATESLYTGPEALRSVPDDALSELLLMFPDLKRRPEMTEPALPIPERAEQKELISRLGGAIYPILQRA